MWDNKKSGIDPILVCAGGVQHTIEKLSRRATSSLQTLSQLKVEARSYERPKSRESKSGQFQHSTLGVPGQRAIWVWVRWSNAENTIWGRWWLPPSPGRGEFNESMLPETCPNTKGVSKDELTFFWLVLDARPSS